LDKSGVTQFVNEDLASEGFAMGHQFKLIKRKDVERLTTLSRSTIYDKMSKGTFPRPVKLGERAVAWRESDVVAWLECRPQAGEVEP
jgi:prophage regulatory protein